MTTHTLTDPDQLIALPDACNELLAAGLKLPTGGYRSLLAQAASAKFPAEKRNAKWFVRRRHLPDIAATCTSGQP